jgi:lipopolysaccharide transport system ATP-binding protein
MYVRLAFAVAAHLEPEILIVDEVLAVGDAEFQKKCLGKMKDVAGHGRTILFVSHNMASLSNLCTRGIYMHNGMLDFAGDIESCIQKYLHTSTRTGDGTAGRSSGSLIKDVRVSNSDSNLPGNRIDPAKPVEIHIYIDLGDVVIMNPKIVIGINDQLGSRITTVATYYSNSKLEKLTGKNVVCCKIESLPLASGEYPLKIALNSELKSHEVADGMYKLNVLQTDYFKNGKLLLSGHGCFLVQSVWVK